MRTFYVIASTIWKGAKWVWTAIVVAIFVSVASTLISGDAGNIVKSAFGNIIDWFHKFGTTQRITIGAIIFLILFAFGSGFITVILKSYEPEYAPPPEVQAVFDYIKKDIEAKTHKEELLQDRKKEAFIHYLHAVEETSKYIRLRGFAQVSQALVFAERRNNLGTLSAAMRSPLRSGVPSHVSCLAGAAIDDYKQSVRACSPSAVCHTRAVTSNGGRVEAFTGSARGIHLDRYCRGRCGNTGTSGSDV